MDANPVQATVIPGWEPDGQGATSPEAFIDETGFSGS